MNTIRRPKIFMQQLTFIDNYFRPEVDSKYNSMFNAVSSERMITIHEQNKTCEQVLRQYPSLYRQYTTEFHIYQKLYRKHRQYFHNNIFEELMKKIWHPQNMHKFNDLDPPSDED
jgi:hypothetical protein